MFNRNTRKRRLLAAEICASSLVATAAHAGYSFGFGAPALGIESMSTHKAVLKGENDASI